MWTWHEKETAFAALDDGSLVNHAETPNSGQSYACEHNILRSDMLERCQRMNFALRDIQPGEEITDNYDDYNSDVGWFVSLEEQFCPECM